MIHLRNASFVYREGKTVFQNLNLSLEAGQILQVIGPNGIGKSSLLKVIVGHMPLSEGVVEKNILPSEIFYLPQLANLSFHIHLKLEDVLKILLLEKYNYEHVIRLGFLDAASLKLNWNSASGGERQRTLLTVAFLSKSKVLLLDEPSNHLDAERSKKLLQEISRYVEKGERSVIIVSHKAVTEFPGQENSGLIGPLEVSSGISKIRVLNMKDYL